MDNLSARYGASAVRVDLNINSIVSEAYSMGVGGRLENYRLYNIIGNSELKKNNFMINYYAFIRMDTHESIFYPKKGMSLYTELRMMTDSGYDSFYMLSFKMKTPISISPSFTIIPSLYFNGALADHDKDVFAANTYWGGVVETSYFYNQIPFVGYKEMAVAYKNALVARLDFQWEIWKNNYLILKWNVGKSSDFIDYDGFIHGVSITAAYNFPIGPLEFSLMSNSVTRKIEYLVNLGYWF
jgi:NTE family protein